MMDEGHETSFRLCMFSPLKTPAIRKKNKKKLVTKESEDIVSDADSIVSVVTRDIRGIAKAVNNSMDNLFESDDDQSIFLTQSFQDAPNHHGSGKKNSKAASPKSKSLVQQTLLNSFSISKTKPVLKSPHSHTEGQSVKMSGRLAGNSTRKSVSESESESSVMDTSDESDAEVEHKTVKQEPSAKKKEVPVESESDSSVLETSEEEEEEVKKAADFSKMKVTHNKKGADSDSDSSAFDTSSSEESEQDTVKELSKNSSTLSQRSSGSLKSPIGFVPKGQVKDKADLGTYPGVKGEPKPVEVPNVSSDFVSDSESESEGEVKTEEATANDKRSSNHNISSSSESSDSSISDSDEEGNDRANAYKEDAKNLSKAFSSSTKGVIRESLIQPKFNKSQRGQKESDLESDIIPVTPKVVYKIDKKGSPTSKSADAKRKLLDTSSSSIKSPVSTAPAKKSKTTKSNTSGTLSQDRSNSPRKNVSWSVKEEPQSDFSESDSNSRPAGVDSNSRPAGLSRAPKYFFPPSETSWNPQRYKMPDSFELKSTSRLLSKSDLDGKQLFLIRAPAKFDVSVLHNKRLPMDGQSCFVANKQTEKQYETIVLQDPSSQGSKLCSVLAEEDDRLSVGPGFQGQLLVMDWVPSMPPVTLKKELPAPHSIPEGLMPTFQPFGSVSPKKHESEDETSSFTKKKKSAKRKSEPKGSKDSGRMETLTDVTSSHSKKQKKQKRAKS